MYAILLKRYSFIFIIQCLFFCDSKKYYQKIDIETPVFLEKVSEIDSRFLIMPDSSVVFSRNDSSYFNLYKCDYPYNNTAYKLTSLSDNFKPFYYADSIYSLIDNAGNQKYSSTNERLNEFKGSGSFEEIHSSLSGRYVIFQTTDKAGIFVLDSFDETSFVFPQLSGKINGLSFDKNERMCAISIDNELYLVDLGKGKWEVLVSELNGKKMNPYCADNKIIFVNNDSADFHQVYSLSLKENKFDQPKHLYSTDNDVRIPKLNGNDLYFIEIINSEYLLKVCDLKSGKMQNITYKGVVYDYDFIGSDKITFSYSDFQTPRSLMIVNKNLGEVKNLSGYEIDTGMSYNFINPDNLCPAYIFYPHDTVSKKGTILFFHPGLHSDFSPRWETVLMSLCSMGYTIFSPNYSMSSGYGKKFQNQNISAAARDMIKWKEYITNEYTASPLFYLAYSSGDALMNHSLSIDNSLVNGCISAFGTHGGSMPLHQTNTLYILGKNDPIIDYKVYVDRLAAYNIGNSNLLLFNDEGHWLRKRYNIEETVKRAATFLSINS